MVGSAAATGVALPGIPVPSEPIISPGVVELPSCDPEELAREGGRDGLREESGAEGAPRAHTEQGGMGGGMKRWADECDEEDDDDEDENGLVNGDDVEGSHLAKLGGIIDENILDRRLTGSQPTRGRDARRFEYHGEGPLGASSHFRKSGSGSSGAPQSLSDIWNVRRTTPLTTPLSLLSSPSTSGLDVAGRKGAGNAGLQASPCPNASRQSGGRTAVAGSTWSPNVSAGAVTGRSRDTFSCSSSSSVRRGLVANAAGAVGRKESPPSTATASTSTTKETTGAKERHGFALRKILCEISLTASPRETAARKTSIFGAGKPRNDPSMTTQVPSDGTSCAPLAANCTATGEPESVAPECGAEALPSEAQEPLAAVGTPVVTAAVVATPTTVRKKTDPFGGAKPQNIFEVIDRKDPLVCNLSASQRDMAAVPVLPHTLENRRSSSFRRIPAAASPSLVASDSASVCASQSAALRHNTLPKHLDVGSGSGSRSSNVAAGGLPCYSPSLMPLSKRGAPGSNPLETQQENVPNACVPCAHGHLGSSADVDRRPSQSTTLATLTTAKPDFCRWNGGDASTTNIGRNFAGSGGSSIRRHTEVPELPRRRSWMRTRTDNDTGDKDMASLHEVTSGAARVDFPPFPPAPEVDTGAAMRTEAKRITAGKPETQTSGAQQSVHSSPNPSLKSPLIGQEASRPIYMSVLRPSSAEPPQDPLEAGMTGSQQVDMARAYSAHSQELSGGSLCCGVVTETVSQGPTAMPAPHRVFFSDASPIYVSQQHHPHHASCYHHHHPIQTHTAPSAATAAYSSPYPLQQQHFIPSYAPVGGPAFYPSTALQPAAYCSFANPSPVITTTTGPSAAALYSPPTRAAERGVVSGSVDSNPCPAPLLYGPCVHASPSIVPASGPGTVLTPVYCGTGVDPSGVRSTPAVSQGDRQFDRTPSVHEGSLQTATLQPSSSCPEDDGKRGYPSTASKVTTLYSSGGQGPALVDGSNNTAVCPTAEREIPSSPSRQLGFSAHHRDSATPRTQKPEGCPPDAVGGPTVPFPKAQCSSPIAPWELRTDQTHNSSPPLPPSLSSEQQRRSHRIRVANVPMRESQPEEMLKSDGFLQETAIGMTMTTSTSTFAMTTPVAVSEFGYLPPHGIPASSIVCQPTYWMQVHANPGTLDASLSGGMLSGSPEGPSEQRQGSELPVETVQTGGLEYVSRPSSSSVPNGPLLAPSSHKQQLPEANAAFASSVHKSDGCVNLCVPNGRPGNYGTWSASAKGEDMNSGEELPASPPGTRCRGTASGKIWEFEQRKLVGAGAAVSGNGNEGIRQHRRRRGDAHSSGASSIGLRQGKVKGRPQDEGVRFAEGVDGETGYSNSGDRFVAQSQRRPQPQYAEAPQMQGDGDYDAGRRLTPKLRGSGVTKPLGAMPLVAHLDNERGSSAGTPCITQASKKETERSGGLPSGSEGHHFSIVAAQEASPQQAVPARVDSGSQLGLSVKGSKHDNSSSVCEGAESSARLSQITLQQQERHRTEQKGSPPASPGPAQKNYSSSNSSSFSGGPRGGRKKTKSYNNAKISARVEGYRPQRTNTVGSGGSRNTQQDQRQQQPPHHYRHQQCPPGNPQYDTSTRRFSTTEKRVPVSASGLAETCSLRAPTSSLSDALQPTQRGSAASVEDFSAPERSCGRDLESVGTGLPSAHHNTWSKTPSNNEDVRVQGHVAFRNEVDSAPLSSSNYPSDTQQPQQPQTHQQHQALQKNVRTNVSCSRPGLANTSGGAPPRDVRRRGNYSQGTASGPQYSQQQQQQQQQHVGSSGHVGGSYPYGAGKSGRPTMYHQRQRKNTFPRVTNNREPIGAASTPPPPPVSTSGIASATPGKFVRGGGNATTEDRSMLSPHAAASLATSAGTPLTETPTMDVSLAASSQKHTVTTTSATSVSVMPAASTSGSTAVYVPNVKYTGKFAPASAGVKIRNRFQALDSDESGNDDDDNEASAL